MFEKEIEEYERIRQRYQQKIADRMDKEQWMEYNEILFSAHSFELHKKNRPGDFQIALFTPHL